jgi:acyl-CoA thioesterase FadM
MDFSFTTTIKLYDTDASGHIFYGSLFRLTQECFERFLATHKLPIESWFGAGLPGLPVRGVDAEYIAPMRLGAEVVIRIVGLTAGTSSFGVSFSIVSSDGTTEYARARVTHVAVDRQTGKPIELPSALQSLAGSSGR